MQSQNDTVSGLFVEQPNYPDSLYKLMQEFLKGSKVQEDPEMLPYLVQILDTLIWPIVVLIVLYAFKREFGGIFSRAKSLKMGASGIEIETFEKTLQRTKSLANVLASSAGISKSFAPPPDPFGPTDPKMIVSKVRLDLDRKLRKKAQAGNISIPGNLDIKGLNATLKAENLLSGEEYQLVEGLDQLTKLALAGEVATASQADEILNIYHKLP